MESQRSRSSRSTTSTHRRVVVYNHGERAVLRVSGTKENPGRRFWGCVYYEVPEEDAEKVRLRKKVLCLKSKVKVAE
ncbi:hypothetical protein PIB30_009665 [Stylosanthes scabra]|uniref:Zinc finger GRF-type domain-containing protein n=1 Tax=Stylosanthes scabra TaxID=79078 RepID=A0ABU6U6S6_9FABA|nr:hypothetical protein [Stylosanthes scabra]